MSNILIGFSMHPRWAYGATLAGFLEPLRTAGLGALEFVLDDNDADWPQFGPLMERCQRLGFVSCFHAPYRSPYTVTGFAGRGQAQVQADYAPMLDIAARFGPATVVVHGAHSAIRPRPELVADTAAFLRWALDRYPSLTLALENLTLDPGRTKIGAGNRDELLRIVEEIDDPRLGICWDLGHDVMNDCYDLPDEIWLRRVCHVHLHDVNEQGVDHYPLIYGRTPYETWLPALAKAGFAGIVGLELKGRQLVALGFKGPVALELERGQLTSLELPQIMEMLADSVSKARRLLAS